MDSSFNCPKCSLHITADECVVGEEIDCPECGEKFRVPPPEKAKPVPVVAKSATPVAAVAPATPAPEHKPLVVPHHHGPQESLVKKTAHADQKHEEKKIRVKTIKRGACVEVGHCLFDEKVTDFLNKIGRENIIHISAIGYGAMDSTGHMLPDYGIMVVYYG
jgi:DNA-directed RNA polymerase subunit RPC12/RpoP